MSTLAELVRTGPDPEGAAPYLDRFVEAGGAVPDGEDGRRLLVALLSNGSYLADLLLADVGRPGSPAGRPQPAPAQVPRTPAARDRRRPAAAARDLPALQVDLRRFARREMLRLGARGDRLGHHPGGRRRAVLAGRRLPGGGGPRLRRRAARRLRRAAVARAPARVRGAGHGQAGRRGAELLLRRRPRLPVLHRRGPGGVADPARILRPPVADGDPGAGRERPRTASCSGSICGCGPRGAAGRSATRWRRPSATTRPSGAPGSGRRCCARAPRPATWRWARSSCAWSSPFVFPRSLGPEAVDEVLALRRLFRQAGHKLGAGFDVKLGAGRHPRRRAGGAAAAAAARRQAPRAARAQHAARRCRS